MQILGVRVDNISMDEALEKIEEFLSDGRQHYIVTPNPDFLVLAQRDKEFREILNKADLSVPDGVGLIFASWFLGKRLKGRVAGVDLVEKILNPPTPLLKGGEGRLENKIFLLGGRNGAAEKIARDRPVVVGFCEDADGIEPFVSASHRQAIASRGGRIRQYEPNILLVALGAPKQEKWIARNLANLPSVKVAIGVGSAFDLLSGQMKRAPKIFQALGVEWLWRLFREPRRWKKVWRSVVVFPWLVVKSKYNTKKCETYAKFAKMRK